MFLDPLEGSFSTGGYTWYTWRPRARQTGTPDSSGSRRAWSEAM